MKLRNEIILIQGQYKIAELTTLIGYSRINTDRIVLITALRFPQFLPDSLDPTNPNQLLDNIIEVLEHFAHLEQTFLIYAEYANSIVDRGKNIQVVEGASMNIPWLYNVVRMFHKNLGQTVVNVKIETKKIYINEVAHSWETGLSLLKFHD